MRSERTAAVSLFQYWKNGSESVEVNPDPPSPRDAIPFHVVIRSDGWIPVSILVFAQNDKHALSRVRQALVTCRDKQYKPRRDDYGTSAEHRRKAQLFLDALDGKGRDCKGRMWVECRPMDVAQICAEVVWASNGDLL